MQSDYLELEKVLSFLGIKFIDYKGHRTSNGHKTAKNVGQIISFFGKDVMTSGQFIQDVKFWNKDNWNDLMLLVDKIEDLKYSVNITATSISISRENSVVVGAIWIYSTEGMPKKLAVYKACLEFIERQNQFKFYPVTEEAAFVIDDKKE